RQSHWVRSLMTRHSSLAALQALLFQRRHSARQRVVSGTAPPALRWLPTEPKAPRQDPPTAPRWQPAVTLTAVQWPPTPTTLAPTRPANRSSSTKLSWR